VRDILLVWRDPNDNLQSERLDGKRYGLRLDPGWLKIWDTKDSEIVRIMPSEIVRLVEYVPPQEVPSNIVRPGPLAIPGGN
jgi:hypothetical protein